MQSLTLKEKQLNEKKNSEERNILHREMELSMKQNFLTQEANRYLLLFKEINICNREKYSWLLNAD